METVNVNQAEDKELAYREAMEECAAFMAKMIEKYGREALKEIEEEKQKKGAGSS